MTDTYDDLRRRLMQLSEEPSLKLGLFGRYGSPSAARSRVQELVQELVTLVMQRFGPSDDLPEVATSAEDVLIGLLLAEHVPIPAKVLAARRRAGKHVNRAQAVCLWLAARASHSVGVSGLWHRWERLLPYEAPLPAVIRDLFNPPSHEGAEQAYLDACRIILTAHIVSREDNVRLELPIPVQDAHRRLAEMLRLATASDESFDADSYDRDLCAVLATVFRVSITNQHDVTIRAIRTKADAAARAHGVEASDVGRLLTWTVRCSVADDQGTIASPESVLDFHILNIAATQADGSESDKNSRNAVHGALLKGRTTLRDEIVKRLSDAAR